ncbi:restriction endonuclease subunit S [Pseudonocardia alni]|uniref:Type I restriction enzyme S subunit n=1 Tax=Pseudonocardia alni TaxID=33907 RepID=A0AA44UKG0_PSEA5|nr:restriction endonuclease subunit S [Pseudonocardia alni]PKB28736.1 type I restriction enzyme S subunit [Pseudonocardia alni]
MSRLANYIKQHVPDGVEYRTLAELGTWTGGITPSKGNPKYWERGTVPWVTSMDISATGGSEIRGLVSEAALRETSLRLVTGPSIAVVMRSNVLRRFLPIGYIGIATSMNQDLRLLTPIDGIDARYVFWVLRADSERIRRACVRTDGSMAAVNSKAFFEWRIPVPPLVVQREIAALLDAFARLEADLGAALEAEREGRRVQASHYRDRLLSFDQDIEWSTLGEIAEYTNGKAHERLVSDEGDVPLVTARFISRNGEANRFVQLKDVLTPASVGDTALVLSDLPNGRALARTFFVDRDAAYAINQRIARIRVRDTGRVAPRFLFHVLNRNPGLLKYDNGSDQTHLSKGQVTGLAFPLPPLPEQERIARILDRLAPLVEDLAETLDAERETRRQQFEYYRDKLLTFKEAAG